MDLIACLLENQRFRYLRLTANNHFAFNKGEGEGFYGYRGRFRSFSRIELTLYGITTHNRLSRSLYHTWLFCRILGVVWMAKSALLADSVTSYVIFHGKAQAFFIIFIIYVLHKVPMQLRCFKFKEIFTYIFI